MRTTDYAALIRQTLKTRYGWTSRDVSVRAEYYSMGSSIHVVVKNPSVPLATVQAITEQAEHIDRCAISGDILAGGNRYVHVRYSTAASETLAAAHIDAVLRARTSLRMADSHNVLIPIDGTDYLLGFAYSGYGFSVWDPSKHCADVMDEAGVARWIGHRGSH